MEESKIKESFSWWRKYIFPIYNNEIPRFLLFTIIYCGLTFNYMFCVVLKDRIIFTSLGVAENPMYFLLGLKLPVVITGIFFSFVYSRMARKYSPYKSFLFLFIPSIAFLILSAIFVKYLHFLQISPNTLQKFLKIPIGGYCMLIIGYWIYFLNNLCVELLGVLILNIFWQLSHLNSSYDEKKRFYPLYFLLSYGVHISSGYIMGRLNIFSSIIVLFFMAGIIVTALSYLVKEVLKNSLYDEGMLNNKNQDRPRNTLIFISLIPILYGICSTCVGVFWDSKVFKLLGNKGPIMVFMMTYKYRCTLITFLVAFLAGPLIGRFSWWAITITAPILVLITSSCFFIISHPIVMGFLQNTCHLNSLWWVVMVGAIALTIIQSLHSVLLLLPQIIFMGSQKKNNLIQGQSLSIFFYEIGKGVGTIMKLYIVKNATFNITPILWFITTFVCLLWMYFLLKINEEMVLLEERNN